MQSNTSKCKQMQADTRTQAHACTHPRMPKHSHTCPHMPTHAYTRPHMPTHAHTRPHTPKPVKKILRLYMALLTIFCGGFLDDFLWLCWQFFCGSFLDEFADNFLWLFRRFFTALFVLLYMQYKSLLPILRGGCKSHSMDSLLLSKSIRTYLSMAEK